MARLAGSSTLGGGLDAGSFISIESSAGTRWYCDMVTAFGGGEGERREGEGEVGEKCVGRGGRGETASARRGRSLDGEGRRVYKEAQVGQEGGSC